MKGITIWEPWASAVGRGKLHETRSWPTSYRGEIAIHAAARSPTHLLEHETRESLMRILGMGWHNRLRSGVILAVGVLTDCRLASTVPFDPVDRVLGDFSEGRYAWRIVDVRFLKDPMPYRGRQRLWNIPETDAVQVRQRLAA
jgi:hypothetical protein